MNIKLRLLFNDRLGIVADISSLIAEKNLNIISMEVERTANMADVYLEAEKENVEINREEVFEILGKISGLVEISFIKTLPREERENRSRVVLDNVSDGVISIDKNGRITTINRVAGRIFSRNRKEAIGRDIKELNLPDFDILDCLNGKKFSNVKKNGLSKHWIAKHCCDEKENNHVRCDYMVPLMADEYAYARLRKTIPPGES